MYNAEMIGGFDTIQPNGEVNHFKRILQNINTQLTEDND